MSEETKPLETNDDRYVKICARVKSIGEQLREQVFVAVESDDYESAFEHLDSIRELDRVYMLSLKTGMEIGERIRRAQEPVAPVTDAPASVPQETPAV